MSSTELFSAYVASGLVTCTGVLLAVKRRSDKTLHRASVLYGPLLIGLVYPTWMAGRLTNGYWPRPSLDDSSSLTAQRRSILPPREWYEPSVPAAK